MDNAALDSLLKLLSKHRVIKYRLADLEIVLAPDEVPMKLPDDPELRAELTSALKEPSTDELKFWSAEEPQDAPPPPPKLD